MSDMLQLVVEIVNSQCVTLLEYHWLNVGNLDDKLKHIGHLRPTIYSSVISQMSASAETKVK
jgi:hypothetical protein